jgi:hypothetical protein
MTSKTTAGKISFNNNNNNNNSDMSYHHQNGKQLSLKRDGVLKSIPSVYDVKVNIINLKDFFEIKLKFNSNKKSQKFIKFQATTLTMMIKLCLLIQH